MKHTSLLPTRMPILSVVMLAVIVGVAITTLSYPRISTQSFSYLTNSQLAASNATEIPANIIPDTSFHPLTDFSGSPQFSGLSQSADLQSFLQGLFDFAIILGAMLAVIQITRGGFIYMTKDVISAKIQAKDIIREAVIGLVLLLSTVLILRQINPDLVKLDLNPETPPTAQTAGNTQAQQTQTTTAPTSVSPFTNPADVCFDSNGNYITGCGEGGF